MSWKRKIKITRNNKIIFEESNIKVKIDLEWLLENKKLRLVDIEGKTNLSYQQLLNIKKWRTTKISFDTIWRFLNAFKCKPNDLFKVIK
jgi:DNA-binding Xre family transcriptional regulator